MEPRSEKETLLNALPASGPQVGALDPRSGFHSGADGSMVPLCFYWLIYKHIRQR